MKETINYRVLTCVIYIIASISFGQSSISKIPDSIYSKTYQELGDIFLNTYSKDSTTAKLYALAYIKKGEEDNNIIIEAQGYHYLSYLYKGTDAYLEYINKIIRLTKKANDYDYPSLGYFLRANHHFKKRAFKDALDDYILANKYGRQQSNQRLVYQSNYYIGLLKNRVGEHKEALKIFRECYEYSQKTRRKRHIDDIFSLVTVFYKLNELDSAEYYNNMGLRNSLIQRDIQIHNYFVMTSGVISYYKKNYEQTIDSINKALVYLEKNDEKPNMVVSYFYLGKAYGDLKMEDKSISNFVKLDSIFQIQKDLLPETREGYEILIDYYKRKGDLKRQLEYTTKLIEVDKVLNSNYKYLLKGILRDYDNSLEVSQKEKTINSLKSRNWLSNTTLTIILILLSVSLVYIYKNYKKRRYYKEKFDLLLAKDTNENFFENNEKTNEKKTQLDQLNISPEIINRVLEGIENFEIQNKYISNHYNLNFLAKELNTNSTYLSKIINVSKGKNFSSYINDLRINYVINKLKEDKKFRLYSIKSISEEIGFKNSESFSKAFYKKTGLYPSYFIKKLK
ncbi:AraC family transcriptional regulator [Aquimarina litoralis]|uniref:AraC family transcriptional regulator n=1 Tax=Aquimarina litoralis TaxID=584605 RepID=UPI001C581A3C|nr:AraC family transcriptional regulator [Aquimarina litoralis]MBW1297805.1 helix-turn-helix domain-containing protein [Aquimarina litoralis]